jgi:DNA (cytosine-5)-methyltransferase 1
LIYKIAIRKWLNKNERLKYPDLPKHLKTHKNEKSFLDRFKVVDLENSKLNAFDFIELL